MRRVVKSSGGGKQSVPYSTRSSFFPAIENAVEKAGRDFADLAVYLGPRGYVRDAVIQIPGSDSRSFLTSWKGDPTRFSARLRAAAAVLARRGIHGTFRAIHRDGTVTLRRQAGWHG
ncbi:MAG TPA: hypothetical protein VFQ45_17135 [Longimicrobium sp.]|nr:hypothetical protein [Longimicrobium sp.]